VIELRWSPEGSIAFFQAFQSSVDGGDIDDE
jgi:hypothetical protein